MTHPNDPLPDEEKADMIHEGFWKWGYDQSRPMPVANDAPFMGQAAFLGCLARVEARAKVIIYRGISQCRLCCCANGNKEYHTTEAVWPEGLRHYIEAHNVMPSQAFIDYITTSATQ